MFNLIKNAIFKHRLQSKIEAEKRIENSRNQVATPTAPYYGFRGLSYDILNEVEGICQELAEREVEL